jgi:hypothetical protein
MYHNAKGKLHFTDIFSFFDETLLFKRMVDSLIFISTLLCIRKYNIRKVYIEMVVLSTNRIINNLMNKNKGIL